ncbi:MAG: hypothetical protein FWC72_00305 [Oscillospiraceae bacterium]|nr:hypothetical protein [Oscillospiraceae bacterium]
MSLIPCLSGCVYQFDGCCTLERTASCGTPSPASSGCVHFVATSGQSRENRVADGADLGQL